MIVPQQEFVFNFEKGSFVQEWPGEDGTTFLPKKIIVYSPTLRQRSYIEPLKKEISNGVRLLRKDLFEMYNTMKDSIEKENESKQTKSSGEKEEVEPSKEMDLRETARTLLIHPDVDVTVIYDSILGLLFDGQNMRKAKLEGAGGTSAKLLSGQSQTFESAINESEFERFVVEYLNAFFPSLLQVI